MADSLADKLRGYELSLTCSSHIPCIRQACARPAVSSRLCGAASSAAVNAEQASMVPARSACTTWSSASCFLWLSMRKPSVPKASARNTWPGNGRRQQALFLYLLACR